MAKKSANWFITEAGLPILMVLILWIPLGSWIFSNVGFAFERVVGSGDLLAICFTLLVSLLVEQFVENKDGDKTKFNKIFFYPILIGVVFLLMASSAIAYGVIKSVHSNYTYPPLKEAIDPMISSMCYFSWTFTLATVVYIYFFLILKNYLNEK